MNALLLLTKPAILTHRRPADTALRRQRGSIYGLARVSMVGILYLSPPQHSYWHSDRVRIVDMTTVTTWLITG